LYQPLIIAVSQAFLFVSFCEITMSLLSSTSNSVTGEPAWDIARLFPAQGTWTEEEYLDLPGNRLVEFDHGSIEVLSMPTTFHQMIVVYLLRALADYVEPKKLGTVLIAALPVKLWRGKFREPDVVFMLAEHEDRILDKHWLGADLAMEVVSDDPESRKRDLEKKTKEYARAKIQEYWIVDSLQQEITVLRLKSGKYITHGRFGPGSKATSALLKGFEVEVNAVFAKNGRIRR
jgi:Uma2 family endonuclease